jgi:hypothetical protein
MKHGISLKFPELILLEEYQGNFQDFFRAVYCIFENHFIKSYPFFDGNRVAVKRYPEEDGLHRTFYHITHEGKEEKNRQPDLRRMERIRFPRFVIDQHQHNEILVWKNKRNTDTRVLLLNENQNYIAVLSERSDYYLLITAYTIDTNHRKRKLLKEYETYKKTKTA